MPDASFPSIYFWFIAFLGVPQRGRFFFSRFLAFPGQETRNTQKNDKPNNRGKFGIGFSADFFCNRE
jgi:hypothetical protein